MFPRLSGAAGKGQLPARQQDRSAPGKTQASKSGVDVMITIFCNFRRKNWRFLKNQCYDKNFALFSFVLSQKRQFFAEKFGENI
jgi:hypothetical protein